jgi:predicted ATPase
MFRVLIHRIHLKNFKSVVNAAADLKALTVIVGSNSAGKSTLMQSLLLLSQSMGAAQRSNHLSLNGPLVDLGYMGDVKNHRADSKDSVLIEAELTAVGTELFDFDSNESELLESGERRAHLAVEFNDSAESSYPSVTSVRVQETLNTVEGETSLLDAVFEDILQSKRYFLTSGRIIDQKEMKTVDIGAVVMEGFLPTGLLEKQSMSILLEKYDSAEGYSKQNFFQLLETQWKRTIRELGISEDIVDFAQNVYLFINRCSFRLEFDSSIDTKIKSSDPGLLSDMIKKLVADSVNKQLLITSTLSDNQQKLWYEKESFLEDFLASEIFTSIDDHGFFGFGRFLRGRSVKQNKTDLSSPLDLYIKSRRIISNVISRRVTYLGPIRQRSMKPPPSIDGRDLGRNGEYAADRFFRLQNNSVKFWETDSQKIVSLTLKDAVIRVLSDFRLVYGVEAHDGGRNETVFKVTPQSGGKEVDLSAVGTGVSQLLPVLMAVLLTKPQEIVIIEQPELHLNPALEKALATFLLNSARCGRQIVVETHSEHLVNRLRRHIAEGDDAEKDAIGILFAQQTDGITQYHAAEISDIGGIVNWPQGFLDLGANEAKELLYAAKAKLEKLEAAALPNLSNDADGEVEA